MRHRCDYANSRKPQTSGGALSSSGKPFSNRSCVLFDWLHNSCQKTSPKISSNNFIIIPIDHRNHFFFFLVVRRRLLKTINFFLQFAIVIVSRCLCFDWSLRSLYNFSLNPSCYYWRSSNQYNTRRSNISWFFRFKRTTLKNSVGGSVHYFDSPFCQRVLSVKPSNFS